MLCIEIKGNACWAHSGKILGLKKKKKKWSKEDDNG
jgi:hypothetical protein